MAKFTVNGPYLILTEKQKAGNKLVADNKDALNKFWDSTDGVKDSKGCYVFGMKVGKGVTPYYVGQTTKRTFSTECFTIDKCRKYDKVLSKYMKGKPVMYFVVLNGKGGNGAIATIKEVEQYLIDVALAKNPDISNIKGTKSPAWSIKGIVRTGKGEATNQSREFKKMMGI